MKTATIILVAAAGALAACAGAIPGTAKICHGAAPVSKVYRGGELVWSASPLPVSGMILRLDASQNGSLETEDGAVAGWADIGPLGKGVRSTVGFGAPAVGSINGLPAVDFDGVDGVLSNAYDYAVADCTLLIVMRWDAVDPADEDFPAGFGMGGGYSGCVRAFIVAASGSMRLATWVVDVPEAYGAARGTVGDPHVWVVRLNGDYATCFIDTVPGTGCQLTYDPYMVSLSGFSIGGLFSYDVPVTTRHGDITVGEFVAYGRALSDTEVGSALSYLKAKWGVTDYVPPAAPSLWFDAAGGSVDPASVELTDGQPYGAGNGGAFPDAVLEGYLFGGWYTEAGGSGSRVYPGDTYYGSSDVTLYAYWYTE